MTLLSGAWRVVDAESRSISPENPTGGKGMGAMAEPDPAGPARHLGRGWKARPCVEIKPGQTLDLADIAGPGMLQSMWFGGSIVRRDFVLRIYWDDQPHPSVECPLPDFFASPYGGQTWRGPNAGPAAMVNSLPVVVAPARGLNCFWEMPFRRRCRITLENRHPEAAGQCFYQVNYALMDIPADAAYFHARFRRENPCAAGMPYTILDGVRGRGHYVGTVMGWGIHHGGWWGEGEIKFYLDGDGAHPTICGTGTEDYFGGAYNWELDGQYVTYSTPLLGMPYIDRPDGTYRSQHRHAMYRWHLPDPIRFKADLRVTIQSLGGKADGFFASRNDISSVAFWYQLLPTAPFPPLGDRAALEVV